MRTLRNTPGPPVEHWPPRSCKDVPTDVFFSDAVGSTARVAERLAKQICSRCPARRPCEDYSVPITNLEGVWAAMTARERGKARTERGI